MNVEQVPTAVAADGRWLTLAERAGLRGGDVLLRANGRALTSPEVLHRVARQASAGESQVKLDLLRDRQPRTITLRW